MEYKNRAKTRKLKRIILSFLTIMKFKWMSLSLWEKIIGFWSLVTFFSLFLLWINASDESKTGNAFSSLAWSVWYIILALIVINIVVITSYKMKEKIKLWSDFHFRDTNIIISNGILVFILSLHIFSFVKWLQEFSQVIIFWKWIILSLTWAILILIWGVIMRKEKKTEKYNICTNELDDEENEKVNEKNMTLPF